MPEPDATRAEPARPAAPSGGPLQAPRAPVWERICEAVVLGFALWTLCAHAVVALGGSLGGLVALYALAGAVAVVLARRLRRPGPPPPDRARADLRPLPRWLRPAGLALAVAAAGVALRLDDPVVLWVLLVLVLGAAAVPFLVIEAPRPARAPRPGRAGSAGWALAALAVACAVYALCVHRPDADDAFYVNLAVAAIDQPELPLLARDTLHGRPDLPIHYPAYRLHAYELWNAAVSLLTGIPPLHVFHLVAAPLFAALVPLCHAVLFRRLTPHCFVWTTLALVVVLGAVGETHRWYGNFAFVRMWQGKAIALFVFAPLVVAHAIRFAERGDAGSWLRLAAAQVAMLGCSSTSLWAAPVAAGVSLCCVLRPSLPDLRRLGAGALASGYVVAAGLLVKGGMSESIPELAQRFPPGEQLATALHTAFGEGRLYAVGVASLFVAWALCPRGLGQRFAIVAPLAVTLVLLDPFTDAWVRANVTGPSYWRAMWAMPAPILMALVLVAPLAPGAAGLGRARVPVFLALLAAFTLLVPSHHGFSERNEGARIGWPGLKVEEPEYHLAQALNALAPRQRVVAPRPVATWVPTARDHARPLVVRVYLKPQRARIGEAAYRDRVVMTSLAEGDSLHPRAPALFARGLDRYDVEAVCLRISRLAPALRRILRQAGFTRRIQSPAYEIWAREP